MGNALILLALVIAVALVIRYVFRKETVFEYQRGLLFQKGVLKRTLAPGQYRYLRNRSSIQKVDVRLMTISVPGQEVLTVDNVPVRITLAAQYLVSDPGVAITKVEAYQEALHVTLQLALREVVSTAKIDELVANRQEIGKTVFLKAEAKVKDYGLTLKALDVKDITFAGDLKKVFAQVLKAQKEGQAVLERTRGETAALRNLANAAKTLEGNPALMQLRMLQSIESSSGNTIVFGWPANVVPIPRRQEEHASTEQPRAQEGPGELQSG
jgi:regulator of protease activity HflC (stomatin/prohibitin superfamily)